MPGTVVPPSAVPSPPTGLAGRIFGVLTSPRATYAGVAAAPRWLGVLAAVVLVTATGSYLLFSTTVGQRALLDQQVKAMESFGMKVTDAAYQRLQARVGITPYFSAASQIVFLPLMCAIIAGIAFGVFGALAGGAATFKQVFAVVAHSGVVIALQQFFVLPLDYVRETLSSPTSLAVFAPMLDENSFIVRFLGAIDLFVVWWAVNLAVGLAVLYRRRTGPIATTLVAIYAAIGFIIAAIKSALGA
jgi:hypothetical protein